jgi:HEXXH motif-containing protein
MTTFEPSAERGLALDLRMRTRLADSLDYIFAEAGDVLDLKVEDRASIVARVRAHRQSPQMFGAYHDLVLAFERDDIAAARALVRELAGAPVQDEMRVAAIDDRPPGEAARCRRLFMSERDFAGAPAPAQLAECLKRIDAAFALLDAGFPAMADEIRTLLREIVIAAGPEDPLAPTFDGASTYMLWGAILLNARGQSNVLDTAQALAHESGHNILFGLCSDGPLVDNPDDDLFSSPLRTDARPMDGVVHATYVVARMHQVMSRLLASGVLDSAQAESARKDIDAHERNFATGDTVVREGARLTAVGEAAIGAARAYMAQVGVIAA